MPVSIAFWPNVWVSTSPISDSSDWSDQTLFNSHVSPPPPPGERKVIERADGDPGTRMSAGADNCISLDMRTFRLCYTQAILHISAVSICSHSIFIYSFDFVIVKTHLRIHFFKLFFNTHTTDKMYICGLVMTP